jgi:hypothetical protein
VAKNLILRHADTQDCRSNDTVKAIECLREIRDRFPAAELPHFKKLQNNLKGDAPWLDLIPAICLAEIPAHSAASRLRNPIGLKAVRAARRSCGSAAHAIIASRRSQFTKSRIRMHSRPETAVARNRFPLYAADFLLCCTGN